VIGGERKNPNVLEGPGSLIRRQKTTKYVGVKISIWQKQQAKPSEDGSPPNLTPLKIQWGYPHDLMEAVGKRAKGKRRASFGIGKN